MFSFKTNVLLGIILGICLVTVTVLGDGSKVAQQQYTQGK